MPLKSELLHCVIYSRFSAERGPPKSILRGNIGKTTLYVHPVKKHVVACLRMENMNAASAMSRAARPQEEFCTVAMLRGQSVFWHFISAYVYFYMCSLLLRAFFLKDSNAGSLIRKK